MTDTDGFVRIPNTLIDHANFTAYELLVYTVLLRYRNPKTGLCWPGLSTIADGARCSRQTVIRTLSALEARGIVKITHRDENQSNVYEVALFDEKHQAWFAVSAKGSRRPQRTLSPESRARMSAAARRNRSGSNSESLVREVEPTPSNSQSLPSDSESPPLVTPSHPKKTKKNKTNEQDLRSDLAIQPAPVTFEIHEDSATERQVSLLSDLWLHSGGGAHALERMRAVWTALTTTEAADLIPKYYRNIGGRAGMYAGPVEGTPDYMALTPTGKRWADTGMDPSTAFETWNREVA